MNVKRHKQRFPKLRARRSKIDLEVSMYTENLITVQFYSITEDVAVTTKKRTTPYQNKSNMRRSQRVMTGSPLRPPPPPPPTLGQTDHAGAEVWSDNSICESASHLWEIC